MLKALLEGEAANNGLGNQIMMWVILGVLVVAIIVFYFISSKKRKKQEQDAQDLINAVKPGNKVKTIGGICGIVVEVDNEENTFVLETGTEASGKSFIKFDRQAIYQTDAVLETPKDDKKAVKEETAETVKTEETPLEATAAEAVKEEAPAETANEAAEEAPATAAEEKPAKTSKKKGKKTEEEKQIKF